MEKLLKVLNLALAAMVFNMAASSKPAAAQSCEGHSGAVDNFCTANSSIKLQAVANGGNEWFWETTSGSGLPAAFFVIRCKNAGVSKIGYQGIINPDDNVHSYSCGAGAVFSYPFIDLSKCGTSSSCQF